MTHDLCYMLFFIIVTNINTPIRQSILRDTRAPFSLSPVITRLRSQDWGFIFWELAPHVNKCRVTLAICYSLGLKSLTHNHSTRAGPVPVCHDWRVRQEVKSRANIRCGLLWFWFYYNVRHIHMISLSPTLRLHHCHWSNLMMVHCWLSNPDG